MELDEKFNENYKKDKSAYEKISKLESRIKSMESEMKTLVRQKEDAEIRKIRAIEDKDKKTQEQAEKDIKVVKEKIEKIEKNIENMKNSLSKSKEKVDSYIEELKKDPEFEEQINLILEKRYNRKLEQTIKEQEQIKSIIDLCGKHPSLENNLKGMIRAKEEIEKLNKELEGLDIKNDESRISEIKNIEIPSIASKKQKNENAFMEFCSRNNIKIDQQFLSKLVEEKNFSHNKKTGEILVTKTLNTISKGYDKKINLYEKSIEKIPNARIYRPIEQDSVNPCREENNNEVQQNSLSPIPKYKWWEVRKRFKDWNQRRKVAKEQKEQEEQEEIKDRKSKSNKFKNSYKYDIVKDYIEKREKEIEQEVKTKSEDKAVKNEEKER